MTTTLIFLLITGSTLGDLVLAVGLILGAGLTLIGLTVKFLSWKYNIRRREGKGLLGKLFGEIYRLKEKKENV